MRMRPRRPASHLTFAPVGAAPRVRAAGALAAGAVAAACAGAPRTPPATAAAATTPAPSAAPALPALHHVGLNTVDPEAAIAWYLRVWPAARRTVVAGEPAVEADVFLLFRRVERPPAGAWRPDLQRAEPQSALWHIGAYTNTTALAPRLREAGVALLPLLTTPTDSVGVWRSGLTPYAGTRTAAQLDTASAAPPRDGGFAYALAPDGVLFEFTGGPQTRDALSHVHLFHAAPRCAEGWYATHLGMALPAARAAEADGAPPRPCDAAAEAREAATRAEASWPSLERTGTIRQPAGSVRLANGTLAWYARQCTVPRCGHDRALAPSRGQALDHVAFTVDGLDALLARLRRAGVVVTDGPYPFGATRAAMIEGPDRLSIELIERTGAPVPGASGASR